MTLAKRIVPALDIKNGRVVKGVNFVNLREVGDPVESAKAYQAAGADELVFLDITATSEERDTIMSVVDAVSREVFIPLTVGGGIRTTEDMGRLIKAGADKIFVNSEAVKNPALITDGAKIFGSQAIVGAIDAKWDESAGIYRVYVSGGSKPTSLDAIEWASELVARGAGELLVTSMDADGTKKGYDIQLYDQLADAVNVPVVASGGAGSTQDFVNLFEKTKIDAALAASVFHFGEIKIPNLKRTLKDDGVEIRI
ncbi:imidazole glycerol phosphate synthase subunit HisF [Leuconostoc mesenteroides]|uniref:imidazole glycerol phosphate synthase subunit HisF n=1 Tax=Leuconostoc mesenteroides TaxID=1245 RepID=UPI00123930E8|nr:imidazole glycerol phosphate synthase subunit HisF [Leuconostoc mesenteroides]KAA8366200.1 imidazole glycerol phosphate synthase subunit HisF [Leuconostoc mesenteroides]MBZ1509053.1 imidazole glycerol phosphate synthase subunit HisF [Leuconostoc mesenteroides]MBZ1512391.1 imidazole glycerol phosphate synthase subunit HisF [Leuconostoc mesenteroides]MBZ1529431.1 imidazole glycerol phosphate synthase subunit HisF [Leuconostoc mesenteroides]MBZ1531802.1 imidazole glycerol phosphate synthase su